MHSVVSLRNMKDLSFILVSNGIVVEISEFFTNMTEYMVKDILNTKIQDVFNVLRIGPHIDIENIDSGYDYFLFTKSLGVRFINIEVVEEMNERIYILREKPDSRLEDKYNYLCQLLSQNISGIAIYSIPDLILLKANQMYLDYFAVPHNTYENAFGKQVYEIIKGWKGSSDEAVWKNLITNGKAEHIKEFKYDMLARGITYWDATITPVFEDGKLKYIVTDAHEITESVLFRKHLEEKNRVIEKQKKELEAVLDNMTDGFSIIDKDGNYISFNKTIRQWMEQIKICKIEDFKYCDLNGRELTEYELPSSRVLRGEKVDKYELLMKSDKVERYLSISGTPIYDEEGNFIIGVLNIRDVTQKTLSLKLVEEQKKVLERAIEVKDDFLLAISHEFRTPLNVINSAVQVINCICKDDLSDKAKEYIGIIRQNTYRQLRLVNNLLDITRANAGRIQISKKNIDIVFLTKAITESVYTYADQKGISLTFESSIKKKVIGIDDEKYERIILNLLSNAIKFTPQDKSVNVKVHTIKNNVCIEVKDTGIGIPEDKIDLIFQKFEQVNSSLSRQAEGTGIGLSLVKKLIEALGGSISVKSKVGKGSTFNVLLPDVKVIEENNEKSMMDLMDNRLIQTTNIEFSDIYQ